MRGSLDNAIETLLNQGWPLEAIEEATRRVRARIFSPPPTDPPGFATSEDGAGAPTSDRNSVASEDEVDWEEDDQVGVPNDPYPVAEAPPQDVPSDGEIERIMARSFATYQRMGLEAVAFRDVRYDDLVLVIKKAT